MTNYSRTTKPLAARPEPVPNWSKLSRADQVEIYRNGKAIASGKIDMLAMDGSMLWIHQDGEMAARCSCTVTGSRYTDARAATDARRRI
ncbi:hypothetical protein [uncultured Arthrobacter sp.]|uniref:hypothetical protein n=1 Tax=uncultured Arthrobacter sp. TaxID=114050 RepID=UPI0028D0887F|nr:hypothetical protein [uncultured Arthrobacter sp.]